MAQSAQRRRLRGLRPQWSRPTHPVYRREIAAWRRSRVVRLQRVGCAPLAFLFFAAMDCLCALVTIEPGAALRERLLIWGLISLGALLAGQAFVSFATGLVATALAATVISGELEAETYGLLRVTGVPTDEIVLAKYAAVLRQLAVPLAAVVAARLLVVAGAAATLDFALRLQGTRGGLAGLALEVPAGFISPLSVGALGLAALVWAGYFIFRPALAVMMHASTGLFASSITRTRVNGIIAAAGLRVTLVVLRSLAGQALALGGQLSLNYALSLGDPILWLGTLFTAQPALVIALGGLLSLGGLLVDAGWRSVLTLLLVRGAVRRAYRLPYE